MPNEVWVGWASPECVPVDLVTVDPVTDDPVTDDPLPTLSRSLKIKREENSHEKVNPLALN
jgi:hypothetical protein